MKKLLVILCLVSLAASAADQIALIGEFEEYASGVKKGNGRLSDDIPRVLYAQSDVVDTQRKDKSIRDAQLIKEAFLKLRRYEYNEALGGNKEKILRFVCHNAALATPGPFKELVGKIKKMYASNALISEMTYGEFLFFTDCGGGNAIFYQLNPVRFKYTNTNINEMTKFTIREVGHLLKEKSIGDISVIDFLNNRIRDAKEINNGPFIDAYKRVLKMVEKELES